MPRTRKSKTTRSRASSDETEFPLDLRQRIEYSGKWVAWDLDLYQIVAATDDFESLRDAAKQAGHDQYVVEWLPPLEQAWPRGGL